MTHRPKDCHLHILCSENLESHFVVVIVFFFIVFFFIVFFFIVFFFIVVPQPVQALTAFKLLCPAISVLQALLLVS
jgi:hypothetical protein